MAFNSNGNEAGGSGAGAAAGGFSFTSYFQESERELPFNQRPLREVNALKFDRKRVDEEPNNPQLQQQQQLDRPLWQRLPAWVPIVCWIGTSSFIILQNKYILYDLKFNHPVALTTVHLTFQTLATRALRRYTPLVDKAKELEATGKMNRDVFIRKIVPVGALFSASLVLSNWVYLRLTVSFIQMIKAFTPVSVLLVSAAFGLKELNRKIMGIVGAISLGVAIASFAEIEFEMIGFLVQALAIAIESCRLVLVQILLQGMGLDPLTSLYYFAPVCLVINSIILLPVEGFSVFSDAIEKVGIPMLLGNACMTFALNLTSVWLIGKASGLVLTLSGVLKDILLIAGSYFILGSSITGTQIFGYIIALTGLVMFKMQG
ncbi:BZ3500_MvSof-1268-A1-R1_Chr2-1g04459 [Microbotryum saponariae]|uniref:BZ3500_MvSof-1268-A1-R1_Chr2-1g04459 protein n=1 Tax=Microbotryum saponariae TaxID=289078 RepID=A0A2X0KZ70_9BASI|nr:BZ3500_MvSof-1268-A1-R1_Chr2-1g04459 [Microbotryum saponariae]SCZ91771.1 BZ3501_MvSof-1269-A2-R1_Chr2-1g04115 [Microbotryum saponariae]